MGAILILSARRRDELQVGPSLPSLATEIPSYFTQRVRSACTGKNQDKHTVLPLDMLDLIKSAQPGDNAAAALAARAAAFHGRIDVFINNAGRSQRALAEATPWIVDREIMELNYTSSVALTKALLPYMIKAKKGHIVNTSRCRVSCDV